MLQVYTCSKDLQKKKRITESIIYTKDLYYIALVNHNYLTHRSRNYKVDLRIERLQVPKKLFVLR